MDQHPTARDDRTSRIARGEPLDDPAADAACLALLATGMTRGSIVAVLDALGRRYDEAPGTSAA